MNVLAALQLAFWTPLAGALLIVAARWHAAVRITSYNVCYTKLLRSVPVLGFGAAVSGTGVFSCRGHRGPDRPSHVCGTHCARQSVV